MSPPSFTASAPSATSPPPPFTGVTHTFLGLSLVDEYLAVTAICVVFILYFLVFSYYKSQIQESESANMAAGGAIPAAEKNIPMVLIQGSVFSYSEANGGDGSDDGECAICLSEFEEGEKCRILRKCGHIFHRSCIDRWLKAEHNCPLCRSCVCIVVHGGNTTIPSTTLA